jgi:hypothetical protein
MIYGSVMWFGVRNMGSLLGRKKRDKDERTDCI